MAEALLEKEMLTRDDMVRLLGQREWESKGEFDKYFGGRGASTGVEEGKGKNPGGIGDSQPPNGPTGGATLPPGLGGGPEEAAPSLFRELEEKSKGWRL